MPYGRGNSFGYPSRGGMSNPRKFLVGSYSNLADAGVGNIAINVPVDASQGKGIQIWAWECELEVYSSLVNTWLSVDGKYVTMVLAKTAGTADRYVNDPDVIGKFHINVELATNGLVNTDSVFLREFYPAIPHIGPQIHVTVKNASGAALNIYTKIWYTDFYVSYPQAVGLLQSQIV